MKLHTKFLIILFPLVVVPLLLNSYITRMHFNAMLQNQVAQQNHVLAEQMSWNIRSAQNRGQDLLNELVSYPAMVEALQSAGDNPAQLQNQLDLFASQLPALEYAAIQSDAGTLLAETRTEMKLPAELFQASGQGRLFQHQQHLYLAQQAMQPEANLSSATYSVRIVTGQPQLEEYINHTRRSSNVLLLLQSHHTILSQDTSLQHLLSQTRVSDNDSLIWNSNRYLVNRTQLSPSLQMIALAPTVEMDSASENLYNMLSYVAICAGFISLLILHRSIASLVSNPLQRFQSLAHNISNGNFSPIRIFERKDEVGELSTSLETMRQHLQDTSRHIEELAYFDPLTGLPNKVSFIDTIQELIKRSQVAGHQVAILFFDLDNFKHVNDGLGHEIGDELLMQVSHRLKECIRSHDVLAPGNHPALQELDSLVARLGGDEFTLVLSKINSPEEAAKVASRILQQFAKPFCLLDSDVFVSASIGISMYPKDGRTPEDLLKNADTAMYAAKSSGKNNARFYDSKMNKPVLERIELEASMRSGLDNDEFILYYQPKVPLFGATRFEFETLMRWNHKDRGMISPGVFIPLAEDSGYIQQLGDWAIEQTCRQIEYWNQKGYRHVSVSTNLSPVQLNYGNPVQTIRNALESFDIEPAQLEIEITESGLMQNEAHAVELLNEIKALGVRIALDDFGTGYSSLAYLIKFPIDTLKIDRTFIKDIESQAESLKVLESIIALAKSLDLQVVAEGVETREQLELLQKRECDLIQGFYFARPSEPDIAMQFFEGHFLKKHQRAESGVSERKAAS